MKRVADRQLIKDDDEDGDDEIEEVGTGFRKADETVLATRQIRGLPRRSNLGGTTTAAPSSVAPDPPSAPKFGGFGGFGSSAPSPAPFSFASPSAPPGAPKLSPALPAASSAPFSFGNPPSNPSFGPSVSSSASPATKAFASIVSSSASATSKAPATEDNEDRSEVEYYMALRGLNTSFLAAVHKAIESDPFTDVAEMLERYKALRVTAKSDFQSKSKAESKAPAPAPAPALVIPTPKVNEAPKPTLVMPAPPTSFGGFGGFKPSSTAPSTSTSSPALGGFVPKLDTSSSTGSSLGSPFNFPTSKPDKPQASSSDAPKSAFSFGSSGAFGGTASSSAPSFGFGNPSRDSSGSIFGTLTTAKAETTSQDKDEADKGTDKLPSLFGSGASSPFGTSTGASTPAADKDDTPKSNSLFSFGGGAPPPPPAFLFGAAPKATGPGALGNPVGFGFGSATKTPGLDAPPLRALPFSFGAKPIAPAPALEGDKEKDESSLESTPAPESAGSSQPPPPVLLASGSVHDQEGEGEEGEETLHEIRSKVYKMTADKEGKPQWGDLGVGVLRVKRHKETDARRLLMRNSSTGKITINFRIHSGMNAKLTDKTVSFMGHDEGASVPYRIRIKTGEQAQALLAALEREIAFVKAKDAA